MTSAEKCELALVPLLAIAAWLAAPEFPTELTLGRVFLTCSVLLLGQSLIRDLWLLFSMRRRGADGHGERVPCMCIESTVGVAGVVTGLVLLGSGAASPIAMDRASYGIVVLATTGFGFMIKDLVFEWSPWRIRVDKDHLNIIFTLKR